MFKQKLKNVLKKLPIFRQISNRWNFLVNKNKELEQRIFDVENSTQKAFNSQNVHQNLGDANQKTLLISIPTTKTIYTEKTIEIVIGDKNWILEKMSDAILHANNGFETELFITKVDTATTTADLVYFMPYTARFNSQGAPIIVANFTHQEIIQPNHDMFIDIAKKCHQCVSISPKYTNILVNNGIDKNKISTIPIGVDLSLFKPKIHIGIVGRTYPDSKRKGEDLIPQLFDIEEIEFHFTGTGWPLPSTYYAEKDMPKFYNSMDYILIPSLIEG